MGEFKIKTEYNFGSSRSTNSPKAWSSLMYLTERERGAAYKNDSVMARYYKYIALRKIWDPQSTAVEEGHGAVFNIEFSPNGSLLVAACERASFLVFDPVSQQLIKSKRKAHSDCVNCVRFLDSRSFLTCSDDKTICLWDARNLKSNVFSLVGHTSWVKSIEYCRESGKLVTSAFDDTIRTWDLNRYMESGNPRGKVLLNVSNLTRMKLTPCGGKMIISSIPGHLVVIHNLDLDFLEKHMDEHTLPFWSFPGNQPGMSIPNQNKPWTAKNKFEVIAEFPDNVIPWCISSLEIHPQGWCVVSRYSSAGWNQEWTAVYDIQTSHLKDSGLEPVNQDGASTTPERLIYCIEEPNVARGYIKEPCFSCDGRTIGSPFGNTSRLLGFSSECEELPKCLLKNPSELLDLKILVSHKNPVLTCRFSPTHPTLATGCLGGKVSFHFPKL
ncbi:predicted protein [Nematostella vectensis]|uniref:WD repeat-containing protein 55 homolog n=1 Tax=Nematostella vectensis TaxID=45351 RepID=A7REZ7_NEMVE|nr:DDB1- and CUL4-associated factor 10 [Nematostella vectensis]EDO49998.1 predicted protein [Nematostella vectensis]|eukprot:XP_001642061.1 predicted protein [Nematostella vectensis]